MTNHHFLLLDGISTGELFFVFLIILIFLDLRAFLKWPVLLEEESGK